MNIKQRIKSLNGQASAIAKEISYLNSVLAGDKPAPEIAKLIKSQRFSFGVKFTRKKELHKVAKPGVSFTSQRRFATRKEADQHGKRFSKKHGHKSFAVIKVAKRANAWVNWETGKTNPVISQ